MQRARIAVLTIGMITGVSLLSGPAHAADLPAAAVPCTVNDLSAMLPWWSVSCSGERRLAVEVTYDAQRYSVNPATTHEAESFTADVKAGSTWQDSVAIPGLYYIQFSCATLTLGAVDAPRLATSCFSRAPLPATGEPPVCGAAELSAAPISWTAGCGGEGGTLTATGTYQYTTSNGTAGTGSVSSVMVLGPWQTWTDAIQLPPGATITHSDVTLTAQPGSGGSYRLGTASFNRW